MNKIFIGLLIPFCAFSAAAQTKRKAPVKKVVKPAAATTLAPKTTLDSASYTFGVSMASNMKQSGLKSLNYTFLTKGFKDAFAGEERLITAEAGQKAANNLYKTVTQEKFAPAIAEGKAFLEKNKKVPGVITTASGLQYQILTPGNGIKPTATDTVLVNYKGSLINGKQFDSSYDRNEPLSLSLDRVIPAWTEGMQLMPTGSKYKFFVPYHLGYGERGAGNDIPPFSTLIFEVELLKVNGK
ncbi:FKBP-type peptidyl-prolyl cis-trans isomerase [Pedobacter sp. AW31-3R]|uniref:FKBP-type peptidyl-prolyl cis-trans isomerase n=1 Tax=Pedobacter sp. AW31-3R TaxID=3445781 RepID=UPI003FA0C5CA